MKIRKLVLVACALGFAPWTQTVTAQQGDAFSPAPVEAFYCDLQDGKTMEDLLEVAERFGKWAKKKDPGYSAWILTPQFGQFGELPQVVWLGSNTDGNAMGKGLDAWLAGGGDIQGAFDEVVNCGSHALASSVEINAPDGPPGDGVVMFTQCVLEEDSTSEEVMKAHRNYSGAMRELGANNSNWLFFPMLGAGELDFDYWGVSTFPSWSDFFAAYELYVSGGGWQKAAQALEGVAHCEEGTPSVWDVRLVRQGER